MENQIIEVKLIILGSGCAGHTAAIYAARADLNPIVLEGDQPGGQLSLTSDVENFPGFPEGINGFELVDNMKKQAIRFGAEYFMENAVEVDLENKPFSIKTNTNKEYKAQSMIIATGAKAKLLGIKGEQELYGRGVSVCATCDGAFFRNKKVVVVGGSDTAMEDSIFLTRFASEVHIMHRRDKLRASKIMQNRVFENSRITVHWNTEIAEIQQKDNKLESLKIVYHPEGKPKQKINEAGSIEASGVTVKNFPCDGLFIAIGHEPNTKFLKGSLKSNKEGYLLPEMHSEECATCDVYTDIPGVFLAGDVVDWKFQQAVTAAGMGCKAAMAAESFLT